MRSGLTFAGGGGVGGGSGAPISFFTLLNMVLLSTGYRGVCLWTSPPKKPFFKVSLGAQMSLRMLSNSCLTANNRSRQFNFLEPLIPCRHSPIYSCRDLLQITPSVHMDHLQVQVLAVLAYLCLFCNLTIKKLNFSLT